MAGSPLFTIVEDDTGREVKLTDHNGTPNAIPISQGYSDEDHRYRYVDGSIGRSPLVQRHEIQLGCDFMPDAVRRRLLRMKLDRKDVQFTPGWGEATELAWRAVEVDGSTTPGGSTWTDLTGQHNLTNVGGGSQQLWDYWTEQTGKVVAPSGTAPALITETPYGAGQSLHPARTNRWGCSEPLGADEGYNPASPVTDEAGWKKAGTNSSQITFAHAPGGFEPADMDALRVTTTADISISRRIEADGLWDSADGDYLGYSFTGGGIMCISFWIKGRLPSGASAALNRVTISGGSTTGVDNITLDGDYSDWTKITMHHYESDWSLYRPVVYLTLSSATGERADFMVSAMSATLEAWGSHYRYVPYGTSDTTYEEIRAASLTKPQSGSLTVDFFIPDGVTLPDSSYYLLAAMNPSTTYDGWLVARGMSGTPQIFFYYDGTNALSGAVDLTPGHHVVTAAWGTGHLALYYDGALVESSSSDFDVTFTGDGAVEVGGASYSPHPLLPLSLRLDHDTHESDYEDLHATYLDSISCATVVAARGRTYEITQIPNTPRIVDGNTYWTGQLNLSQVGYDSDLADVTSKEL